MHSLVKTARLRARSICFCLEPVHGFPLFPSCLSCPLKSLLPVRVK